MSGLVFDAKIRNLDRLNQKLLALGNQAPIAVQRALNRTGSSLRTQAVRDIGADLHIPQAAVRKGIELQQATRANLRVRMLLTGRRIALYAFRARPTRAGVTYDLGRGRSVAPGAFIATMRSGHTGAFRRRTKRRLPIDELFGPSLARVFKTVRRMAQWKELIRDLMHKNLEHEVDFLVRGIR